MGGHLTVRTAKRSVLFYFVLYLVVVLMCELLYLWWCFCLLRFRWWYHLFLQQTFPIDLDCCRRVEKGVLRWLMWLLYLLTPQVAEALYYCGWALILFCYYYNSSCAFNRTF